jgi:hypothetical protein
MDFVETTFRSLKGRFDGLIPTETWTLFTWQLTAFAQEKPYLAVP